MGKPLENLTHENFQKNQKLMAICLAFGGADRYNVGALEKFVMTIFFQKGVSIVCQQ